LLLNFELQRVFGSGFGNVFVSGFGEIYTLASRPPTTKANPNLPPPKMHLGKIFLAKYLVYFINYFIFALEKSVRKFGGHNFAPRFRALIQIKFKVQL